MHGTEAPSLWVSRFMPLVPAGGRVLDLACGHGRHSLLAARHGHAVTALDRDAAALAGLRDRLAAAGLPPAERIEADIEGGPWPLTGRQFDGVIVTHYLWRPLLPAITALLAEGGVLIYETFARGHETVGRPSRPDFLLNPGELLQACAGLRVLAYEDGYFEPPPRFAQRICAVRKIPTDGGPRRYPLAG